MSSKKTTSKAPAKASASEKKTAKPAPKKAPEKKPAKAPAPAKKAAPAKAAPAPAKKPAPAKPAAPVKAASAKKPVVKKDAPAKAEPAKIDHAKAEKAAPVKKTAAVKDVKTEVAKKPAPVKKVEPAVEAVSVKEDKENTSVATKKIADKDSEKKMVKNPDVVEVHEKHDSKKKVEYPYSVLLEGGKKPCKFIMFVEIDEQEERANKKKVTSEMKNLEKKPTSAIRHKISLAEETQEELTERILKELEEQNAAFTREAATQICTRCNKNLVSPEFWVDKHLGYCEECATILHLGQSKEARKVEYQLGAMGGDSLDEADDDEFEGPDAADLKEAEEELADFDN